MGLIAAANPGLDDFFTWESLGTFQGATAAIVLVVNSLGFLIGQRFNKARKWVAFVLAIGIEFVLVRAGDASGLEAWVVAGLNALLLFAAAVGINEGAGSGQNFLTGSTDADRKFFKSWVR
jgi:chromate transport protein ChrA